jgi:hypothetical protein
MTAAHVNHVDQTLPAALLVWIVFFYRQPIVTGLLFGPASLFVFPAFLVPLWCGFYFRGGFRRFLIAFVVSASASIGLIAVSTGRYPADLWAGVAAWRPWEWPKGVDPGIWGEGYHAYRIPIALVFAALTLLVPFWPPKKNLGEMIGISTALVIGTQFWFGERGGANVNWYLPILLIMIFRPNLQNVFPKDVAAATAA